jgi:magnesium chelatase family protein
MRPDDPRPGDAHPGGSGPGDAGLRDGRRDRGLVRLHAGDFHGIEGRPVEVQVDFCRRGDPRFQVVGLAGKSTRESRDRIQAALRNSGYRIPPAKILVNLAPASQKKEGAGFDLPVALGILLASSTVDKSPGARVDRARLSRMGFLGELGLEGELRAVRGALLMADAMVREGVREIVVPSGNVEEVAMLEGPIVYGVRHLREAIDVIRGDGVPFASEPAPKKRVTDAIDFSEVRGQEATKRGILIAAAGGHNVLLCGAPGVGKTMLARRIPTILPELSVRAAMEVMRVRSVCEGDRGAHLDRSAPFRAPHHTVSYAGLVGGGAPLTPGEVTRAHRGVLFLDEFPEFAPRALEALREPLEEREITVGRVAHAATFPADLLLVAAMNPCPCGYLGHPKRPCRCTPRQVELYGRRLSGPLRDRIDVFLPVASLDPAQWIGRAPRGDELDSATMRREIVGARRRQHARWKGAVVNARASLKRLVSPRVVAPEALELLRQHAERLSLSARGFTRTLKVARTIADVAGEERVEERDIVEALMYREAMEM